jgi:hypothetical protein
LVRVYKQNTDIFRSKLIAFPEGLDVKKEKKMLKNFFLLILIGLPLSLQNDMAKAQKNHTLSALIDLLWTGDQFTCSSLDQLAAVATRHCEKTMGDEDNKGGESCDKQVAAVIDQIAANDCFFLSQNIEGGAHFSLTSSPPKII